MPCGNGRGSRWTNGSATGRGKNHRFARVAANGIRRRFFPRSVPESGPPHMVQSCSSSISQQSPPKERELSLLKQQAYILQRQIDSILNRIDELNKKPQKEPEREASVKAYVIIETCAGCGICLDVCKEEAITVDAIVRIDENKCTGCGDCVKMCPNGALILR
jgi:ferredoxin